MNIQWTREAQADLESILEDASTRSKLEASNIVERVKRTELNIQTFPKAAYFNKEHAYYERYIPRTRIILVYRIIEPNIIIIAAFHTSRSPDTKPRS